MDGNGTVFVNNIKLVLRGSSASPDSLCVPLGPPHCNPKSVGASGDVFACGGGSGGNLYTEKEYSDNATPED